jgi:hypothetical protein
MNSCTQEGVRDGVDVKPERRRPEASLTVKGWLRQCDDNWGLLQLGARLAGSVSYHGG